MIQKLILFCICFYIMVACNSRQEKGDTNLDDKDLEAPIATCIKANSEVFGNSIEPKAFCKCLVSKLYIDFKNDPEELKFLKEGNWQEFSKGKQAIMTKYYEECMEQSPTSDSTAKVSLTPRMVEIMRKKLKAQLIGSDVEHTNDIDKLCDCLINSLQKDFTAKEVMEPGFHETEKYQKAMEVCLEVSRKK